jgi:hypothetical protein
MTSVLTHHYPLQPKKKNLDVGFSWVEETMMSLLFLSFFSSLVEDANKPKGSSLFLTFFPHFQKMTMSWAFNSSSSLIVFL